MTQGLEYPDNPSAEGYMPNFNEAWDRITQFQTLLQSEKGLDLTKEIDKVRGRPAGYLRQGRRGDPS